MLVVPCAGRPTTFTVVIATPATELPRSMLTAVLYGVLADFAATVGAAGTPTVIVTVAGAEVPPGFVAV
jgi:hypothetical protein